MKKNKSKNRKKTINKQKNIGTKKLKSTIIVSLLLFFGFSGIMFIITASVSLMNGSFYEEERVRRQNFFDKDSSIKEEVEGIDSSNKKVSFLDQIIKKEKKKKVAPESGVAESMIIAFALILGLLGAAIYLALNAI